MSGRVTSNGCSTADASENFQVNEGNVLDSGTSRYLILEFIGQGSFGKVAQCVNVRTAKEVAVKIIKRKKSKESEREIEMLNAVSILDPAKANVVQFFEMFQHNGYTCLAFEMLHKSLHHFMESRSWQPLSLNEIRPIAQQLLTAFDALKGIGVVHADLKLDNVMLVNHDKQPLQIKLIDFGLALKKSELQDGMIMSVAGFRAPEVFLGLPLSEAIDMWALGCILAQLYISQYLFGMECKYNVMASIVDIVGKPADHLLSAGMYTKYFFKENRHLDNQKWWLKTALDFQLEDGIRITMYPRSVTSLDDLVTHEPAVQEIIEVEDRRAFVSLLKYLLQTDPERRISPGRALKHPFISKVHLKDALGFSPYVEDSFDKMRFIPHDTTEEEPTPNTKTMEISLVAPGSVPPCSYDSISHILNGASVAEGSFSLFSCDGISEMPDGAPVADGIITPGSFEDISFMPDGATVAEETAFIHHEATSAKVKMSRLKRIRKFFGRAIRTIFGKNRTSA